MKTKMLLLVLTISFLVWFAWNAHMPGPVQADDVPQEYRETVNKGLEYLAARQIPDRRVVLQEQNAGARTG